MGADGFVGAHCFFRYLVQVASTRNSECQIAIPFRT